MIPFNSVKLIGDNGTLHHNGMGDIAEMGNYKLFSKVFATSGKKLIAQTIWIGAGIKAAIGKFNVAVNEPDLTALAKIEVGSGSTDFMFNANYIISLNKG